MLIIYVVIRLVSSSSVFRVRVNRRTEELGLFTYSFIILLLWFAGLVVGRGRLIVELLFYLY